MISESRSANYLQRVIAVLRKLVIEVNEFGVNEFGPMAKVESRGLTSRPTELLATWQHRVLDNEGSQT